MLHALRMPLGYWEAEVAKIAKCDERRGCFRAGEHQCSRERQQLIQISERCLLFINQSG
jgi:hypothetical protein